jgi:hypothetical protein
MPEYVDPHDPVYSGHRTEVIHHGHADDPAVLDLVREDADVETVTNAIRQAHYQAMQAEHTRHEGAVETVVGHTPNGRDIRQTADGKFAVQPHNDNYWIECDTMKQALDAYEHPEKYRT